MIIYGMLYIFRNFFKSTIDHDMFLESDDHGLLYSKFYYYTSLHIIIILLFHFFENVWLKTTKNDCTAIFWKQLAWMAV